jgi:hypothetical protein
MLISPQPVGQCLVNTALGGLVLDGQGTAVCPS